VTVPRSLPPASAIPPYAADVVAVALAAVAAEEAEEKKRRDDVLHWEEALAGWCSAWRGPNGDQRHPRGERRVYAMRHAIAHAIELQPTEPGAEHVLAQFRAQAAARPAPGLRMAFFIFCLGLRGLKTRRGRARIDHVEGLLFNTRGLHSEGTAANAMELTQTLATPDSTPGLNSACDACSTWRKRCVPAKQGALPENHSNQR
jgi:hypothetical protein